MKKALPFLIVCGIVCILPVSSHSQTRTAQAQSATDACPAWGKKQTATSKADYFAYLSKNPKHQENKDFYTPKYQNVVARKPVPVVARNEKHIATKQKREKVTRADAPAVVPEKQVKAGTSKEDPIVKPADVPEPEFITKKEDTATKAETPVKEKGNATSSAKKENKQADQNKKTTEVNHPRKHLFKGIGGRKKRAADCPQF